MSHRIIKLMDYKHQFLMDELNELMVNIKTHLFNLPLQKPKPTNEEIDSVFLRTIEALKQEAKPMRQ